MLPGGKKTEFQHGTLVGVHTQVMARMEECDVSNRIVEHWATPPLPGIKSTAE